jgi:hypothetical protein
MNQHAHRKSQRPGNFSQPEKDGKRFAHTDGFAASFGICDIAPTACEVHGSDYDAKQQRCAGIEIGECRGIRRSGLGAIARDKVEFGELGSFFSFRDQRGAAVELIDDLEDRLPPFLGGVYAASRRPIRRWVSARNASGIGE